MATTQVKTCNLALIKVGGKVISALDDGSKGGDVCTAIWDDTVKEVLTDLSWPLKRAELTLSVPYPEPKFDWEYCYPVPTDFLDVLSIANENNRIEADAAGFAYDVNILPAGESAAITTCIVTNLEDAWLEYVAEKGTGGTPNADIALFPAPVITAIEWKLAEYLAITVANSRAKQELALKMYEKKKGEARRILGTRRQQPRLYTDSWVNARGGSISKGKVPKITNYP